MAAARLDPTPTTSATGSAGATSPGADRQQWWQDVQFGVSAMLTEAAHAGASHRLAG